MKNLTQKDRTFLRWCLEHPEQAHAVNTGTRWVAPSSEHTGVRMPMTRLRGLQQAGYLTLEPDPTRYWRRRIVLTDLGRVATLETFK